VHYKELIKIQKFRQNSLFLAFYINTKMQAFSVDCHLLTSLCNEKCSFWLIPTFLYDGGALRLLQEEKREIMVVKPLSMAGKSWQL